MDHQRENESAVKVAGWAELQKAATQVKRTAGSHSEMMPSKAVEGQSGKHMNTITKQGLRASLYAAMEFGFKQREQNHNLEMARDQIREHIEDLVKRADNCPTEMLRIEFRKDGAKLSCHLREDRAAPSRAKGRDDKRAPRVAARPTAKVAAPSKLMPTQRLSKKRGRSRK